MLCIKRSLYDNEFLADIIRLKKINILRILKLIIALIFFLNNENNQFLHYKVIIIYCAS